MRKSIKRLLMFVCLFVVLGTGTAYAQDDIFNWEDATAVEYEEMLVQPGTHTYAFWTKTCTVMSFDAWGCHYCDMCGSFIMFEDAEQSDRYARHHCLEVHSACGDGQRSVCPFGG